MEIKKMWHIAISLDETKKPITISVRSKWGYTLLGVLALLILFIAFSFVYISHKRIQEKKIIELKNENDYLSAKIAHMLTVIDSISTKLDLMQDWENQVRSENKLKEINNDIRKAGQGGIPNLDTLFISQNKDLLINYNLLLNKLDNIHKRTDFNFNTHKEVVDYLKLRDDFYANTPSIYPTYGRISSPFGWRRDPFTKKRTFHSGLDFGNVKGTPIYATADGEVKKVGRLKLFGKYIYIKHKYGYETRYAHLNKYIVKKGDKVKKGQIIGYMGNTGRSRGNHLHYEVLRYGRRLNPYYYLNKSHNDLKLAQK